MSDKQTTVTVKGGLSASTILFFIFLVLKLTKVINWSWWWITAPLWGSFAIMAIILLLVFIGFVLAAFFGRK